MVDGILSVETYRIQQLQYIARGTAGRGLGMEKDKDTPVDRTLPFEDCSVLILGSNPGMLLYNFFAPLQT